MDQRWAFLASSCLAHSAIPKPFSKSSDKAACFCSSGLGFRDRSFKKPPASVVRQSHHLLKLAHLAVSLDIANLQSWPCAIHVCDTAVVCSSLSVGPAASEPILTLPWDPLLRACPT